MRTHPWDVDDANSRRVMAIDGSTGELKTVQWALRGLRSLTVPGVHQATAYTPTSIAKPLAIR